MADSTIGLPADGPGKKIDAESLTVAATTVHRERMQLAGAADVEIAVVKNTDPSATDHALVVRDAAPISPKVDYASSTDLAIGGSIDLDGSTITSGATGKLLRVIVGASIPAKWIIKTRDGAVEVTYACIFTSGVTGGNPSMEWEPRSKDMVTLAGAGVDENFRVTVINLGQTATAVGDVHATIEWDEVT